MLDTNACVCLGIPTLAQLTEHLSDVTDWKDFAIHLLPVEVATEIEIISNDHSGDTKECKRRVYILFLRQGECSWQKVVEALQKSNYPRIAQTIRTTFCV